MYIYLYLHLYIYIYIQNIKSIDFAGGSCGRGRRARAGAYSPGQIRANSHATIGDSSDISGTVSAQMPQLEIPAIFLGPFLLNVLRARAALRHFAFKMMDFVFHNAILYFK